jgi:hypothetical protein
VAGLCHRFDHREGTPAPSDGGASAGAQPGQGADGAADFSFSSQGSLYRCSLGLGSGAIDGGGGEGGGAADAAAAAAAAAAELAERERLAEAQAVCRGKARRPRRGGARPRGARGPRSAAAPGTRGGRRTVPRRAWLGRSIGNTNTN